MGHSTDSIMNIFHTIFASSFVKVSDINFITIIPICLTKCQWLTHIKKFTHALQLLNLELYFIQTDK